MPKKYTDRKLSARYPVDLKAWKALKSHYADLRTRKIAHLFSRDASRAERFSLSAGNLTLDYSKNLVNATTRKLFARLAKEAQVPAAIEAIRDYESVYLMAVGGAAYLVAQAIKAAKVVAFPELGMEAVYEFELEDMPVTVAVDHSGESVHQTGPKLWAEKINQRIVEFGA